LTCFSFLLALITSGIMVSGCKPSSEVIAAREERINREVENLFAQIHELQFDGKITEAIDLTQKSLATKRFEAHKARFFGQKIELLLAKENDAEAGDIVITTWRTEPELARSVFGRLYSYYQQRNDNKAIKIWCKRLLGLGSAFPNDLRLQVVNWQLTASLALKDLAGAQADIDDIFALLKPEEAAPLLQQTFGGLLDSGQHSVVSPLVDYINKKNPKAPLYRNLIVTFSLRCVLASNAWDKFPVAFQNCVTQLPDDQLLQLTRTTFSTLQRNNHKELIEQACKCVIFNASSKTSAVNFASRTWVEDGVAVNKKLLPERLDALLNAKVSPIQVGNLFDRYFYEMVDNRDIVRSLCTIGEHILSGCSDEQTVNNVKVKVLDGAFIVENYDLAIHMLEQGIPGKDKTWHDMSLPKVKAHRAMAQKKPREAVKYFREFMDSWIASNQEEEYDPTSGIAYSREWILGRNAFRIAGILDSIPDKAEADKARAEAKAYFKVALEKAKGDTEAMKLLNEEIKKTGLL
jgi:outer membrane murein-binding lipoprotein Lpp